jgi:glutamate synthase domain-containing protein 2/glutamate synthase domain-containing protein 1/glutamate synthase domain-containing protein 3
MTERDACGVGFVASVDGRRSHDIVKLATTAVAAMAHRGGMASDGKSGDGAGILTQIPLRLLRREFPSLASLREEGSVAVGMVFLPQDPRISLVARDHLARAVSSEGLELLGWREVPVNPEALGEKARRTCPHIVQAVVARPGSLSPDDFERALYLARKRAERAFQEEGIPASVPSLSSRTVVYKALCASPQLPRFYPDLCDPDFDSAIAIFHQRYSTNTFPSWHLAQPFRLLAHNGEINTLQGNIHWTRAREAAIREGRLDATMWGDRARDLLPVLQAGGSDSSMLDNVLELLVMSGRDPVHALLMLIPYAWEEDPELAEEVRGFYAYHACLTEPWDGPAAIAFSDGRIVGMALDRNGLRPARYVVTSTGLVVAASEAGVVDLNPGEVVERGRLGPGQILVVDTQEGEVLHDPEVKRRWSRRRPYAQWVRERLVSLEEPAGVRDGRCGESPFPLQLSSADWDGQPPGCGELLRLQVAFGYSQEENERILRPMAEAGKDPLFAMGDDTPLAVLSSRPRLLYDYFKQRFAQVTNPAIDPLRERSVMSLHTYLGDRSGFLKEEPAYAGVVRLSSPILSAETLNRLEGLFPKVRRISCLFEVSDPSRMEARLGEICREAAEAVEEGAKLLILSDRGVDPHYAPIPMLLAVGAVHNHLIRTGKRLHAGLVAETGEARTVHHVAALVGYGANAVCPYLALETVRALWTEGDARGEASGTSPGGPEDAERRYCRALEQGLLKVMSKMGISTFSGYCGGQVFEAVGLDREVVDRYFADTPSRLGGIGLAHLAREVLARHSQAFGPQPSLEDPGYIRFRKGGEYHAFHPDVVRSLHQAVRTGDPDKYQVYAALVADRPTTALRDLLEFRPQSDPVPLEEVEPVESIVRRFVISAMSHGALSLEAHAALAEAANRVGARSNSGEGGEAPARYRTLGNSRIKQVASGRFGVTPEYLVSCDELEIKIAQGSKPGEGGQLPGHKVSAEIAAIRRSVPGVTLISPPPHHDIYSIEDLAQLIYDLKTINPTARVSVKLVAEAGVGTIAAGVAKAHADTIHISGHDGGTGASPLDSIKNAGVPWELGLVEAQHVLVQNGLRSRVRLRVDGGLKTGRDVVVAALLGADEFGFGTAALVALGCVMARQCHLNTCPVGIATQDPKLREKFRGTPEHVMNFLLFVASEVRKILAQLGFRTLEEAIGRVDCLAPRALRHPKAEALDLSLLLSDPDPSRTLPRRWMGSQGGDGNSVGSLPEALDDEILKRFGDALERGEPVEWEGTIRNTHRAVGARIAGRVASLFGDRGLPEGTIRLRFWGTAGQSFGAFCIQGMWLELEGEANDYVGKGMAGGVIVLRPQDLALPTHRQVIMGNTVLYGATGGYLFAAGRAGERFAVRNSGCVAVVEGVGDHGCEYMTGGTVVVLGETGRNFGAGMTNGVAFVLDEEGRFHHRYNPELVTIERVADAGDIAMLRELVALHWERTGSPRAAEILARWEEFLPLFWKVRPRGVEKSTAPPQASLPRRARRAEGIAAPFAGSRGK